MAIEGRRFLTVAGLGFLAIVAATLFIAGRNQRYAAGHSGALLLAEALERYRGDNGRYPTQSQGLHALVEAPDTEPVPSSFRDGGYVDERVLIDPWGHAYEYRIPGVSNPGSFDVFTLGRDGAPGGTGVDRDLGNFPTDSRS